MDTLILVIALAPIVDVAARSIADLLAHCRWERFALSPVALASCDHNGCDHPPDVNLGGGVYVCRCHL
ncbi:MAG: hypothetical protein A2Y38_22635 [Spirochaetes bacterium GWB1_59_5]|nr:MAG: hypothetical protein A2Y38_22635 [Spirochaetes bacterium GWB1_59_5]